MAEVTGEPIGFVTAIRRPDGTYGLDCADAWPSRELAEDEASQPLYRLGLNEGESFVACAVVALEDGRHG